MNDIDKHLNSCDFHLGYKKPSDGHLYYTDIRPADLIAQASHQLATKFHLRKNVDSKNMKNAFASSNTLGLMIHTEEKHTKGSPKIEDTELNSEKNYYAIKKG